MFWFLPAHPEEVDAIVAFVQHNIRIPFTLMLTPNRWNGVVVRYGGSWKRPQLIAARSVASARFTVAISRPLRWIALNRRISLGFSSTPTGRWPSTRLISFTTVDRDRIAQPFCLDVVREVQVEEVGDGQADGWLQYVWCHMRVATGHDLRGETSVPRCARRSVST